MYVAVLSDTHGNYVALDRCLQEIEARGINNIVLLGDYLGELPYPQRTMKKLYELKKKYNCYFIRGNRENYWLDYKNTGEHGWKKGNSATGSLLYTYENLQERDLEFFANMPIAYDISMKGFPDITICHGSPEKVSEKLLDDDKTHEIMLAGKNKYIICGHTHVQGKIEYKDRIVLNPGSVGVPLESNGKTQFMIYTSNGENLNYEFISLDYDTEKVLYDLQEVQMLDYAPYWCRVTMVLLKDGRIPHGRVLARAMDICRESTGECNWPDIPDIYWEQAVQELLFSKH